ncbi:MAG: hypothetical protein HKN45_01560 [Flavobacteriales bacterium]|nr:hypothetical protein [Flavobacteriales bacterium]
MRTFILLILVLLAASCLGQDRIEIRKPGQYFVNGFKKKNSSINEFMRASTETASLWQRSKAPRTVGSILGFAGGFGLGWSLSNVIFQPRGKSKAAKELDEAMLAIGIGATIVSIPFYVSANKRGDEAVRRYNSELVEQDKSTSFWMISSRMSGISLSYNF